MTGVSMAVANDQPCAVEALSARGTEIDYESIGGGAWVLCYRALGSLSMATLPVSVAVIFSRQHPRAHSGNFIFPLCRTL